MIANLNEIYYKYLNNYTEADFKPSVETCLV